jgi:hypothetical protein
LVRAYFRRIVLDYKKNNMSTDRGKREDNQEMMLRKIFFNVL